MGSLDILIKVYGSEIDYVPLYENQWKQLDCPVFLPGIK